MAGIVATAEIDLDAPPERVWQALTDPDEIEKYMFGTRVETDWKPEHPIVWKGEYEGRSYEDKGTIIAVDEPSRLELTHFSPMTGQEDKPENYHQLAYVLEARGEGTHLSLSQDNNPDDEAAEHSKSNWQMVLDGLKKHLDGAG